MDQQKMLQSISQSKGRTYIKRKNKKVYLIHFNVKETDHTLIEEKLFYVGKQKMCSQNN